MIEIIYKNLRHAEYSSQAREYKKMSHSISNLVRKSQVVQSVIYGSDIVVKQVLTHVVLSLGGQLGLFPFAEHERTKT